MSLDAERIRELVGQLSDEERQLFTGIFGDVKDRGSEISDAMIHELARKYADKARQLAGQGEKL